MIKNQIGINIVNYIETDILVVGGGLAGVSAVLSATRKGKKVLLCEQGGTLGGMATLGHVSPLGAVNTCETNESFGGIMEEIVSEIRNMNRKYCRADANSIVNPSLLQLILNKKISDSCAQVLFHTTLCQVKTGNGRITSAYILTKSGVYEVKASVYIDASGDGDMFSIAGDDFFYGSDEDTLSQLQMNGIDRMHFEEGKAAGEIIDYGNRKSVQPVSCMFTLGGVEIEKGLPYCNRMLKYEDLNITKAEFMKLPYAGSDGFEENGDLIPLPQGRLLFYNSTRKGEVTVNMSRIIGVNTTDPDSLSKAQIKAQLQVLYLTDFLHRFVPGFESSYLLGCAFTLGIRESRRLNGRKVLKGNDAYNCVCDEEAVAYGSYMIDIHDPNGKRKAIGGYLNGNCYGIPFGCLLSKNFSNLAVCGRCISADHVAHASTRIQGTCIQTGQAAGTAAALAVSKDIDICDVDVAELRRILKSDHMYMI